MKRLPWLADSGLVLAVLLAAVRSAPATAAENSRLEALRLRDDALPAAVNWREAQSPVRFQAERGTCTSFGLMAMLETLPGVPADLSEQWVYGQTKLGVFVAAPQAKYIEGTELKNYLDTLRLTGVVPEAFMPYNPKAGIWTDEAPTRERFEKDLAGARLFDLLSFAKLTWKIPAEALAFQPGAAAKDVRWIQEQLAGGAKAVAAGYFTATPFWEAHDGTRAMQPGDCVLVLDGGEEITWEEARRRFGDRIFERVVKQQSRLKGKQPHALEGGHVVTIVGYDREGFIFKNSWSDQWGDRGYGRMTYDFHRLFADEACAVKLAEFRPEKTTESAAELKTGAISLKVVPTRSAGGAAAMSFSLVWRGPGVPVVWQQAEYLIFETKSGEIWGPKATAESAESAAFRTGYPVEVEVGEHAGGEFLVVAKLESARGEKVSVSFLHVRRTLAETVSTTTLGK